MVNSRELAEQAFSLLQDALKDSEARAAELDAELKKQRVPRNAVEEQALVLEHRIEAAEAERERYRQEAAQLAEVLENERVKLRKLRKKLEIAESGPNAVDKKEVNFWRSRAEEFDKDTREYKQRIAALRKQLNERPEADDAIDPALLEQLETTRQEALERKSEVERLKGDNEALQRELEGFRRSSGAAEKARSHAEDLVRERDARLAEQTARIAALSAEASDLKSRLGGHETSMGELTRQIGELKGANDRLNSELADRHSEFAELKLKLDATQGELAAREQTLVERDRRLSELAEQRRIAEEEKRAIREQLAGLEDELKEEKECTVNLSQLANERREQINELSEKLDITVERFEEAKWKLERAGIFERLLKKRRKLIDTLVETIRARQKANTALKAGLDGLRRFKAKSEQQQQKLLMRVEELTAKAREAEERSSGKAAARARDAGDKLQKAEQNAAALQERLDAQMKLIETLEAELGTAKAARQSADRQAQDLTELKSVLEKKNSTIERLESDLDEQQRQLGKLRGSESESMRLKAEYERDRSRIGELEQEIAELKAELEFARQAAAGGVQDAAASASAEIRKRDALLTDLKRTNKDQEKEIARLKEAVAGWQKKYEFLSAEPPSAYQSSPGAAQPAGDKQPARN